MTRTNFLLALLISAFLALLPLVFLAWMTSGAWSSNHVRWQNVALVFPMLVAVNIGLGYIASLVVSFFTYWVMVFALLAWYVRRTAFEIRPTQSDRRGD
jgi:hypothetical protein